MTDKITFDTSDELGKTIRDLADSEFDKSLKNTMNHLVAKALNMENRYSFLDDHPCILRDYLGEKEAPPKKDAGFYCLKKAPALTLLGSGIAEAAGKICKGCQIRDGALTDSKLMKERVKKGVIVDIPSCKHGGQLSEDGTKLYCKNPHMTSQYRDVEKWCKVVRNKANCESLKWTRIAVKGKLPDGQNL